MFEKHKWYASESAPKDYPAYLLTSYLVLQDGQIEGLPSDRVVGRGWGALGSIQLIGDEFKAPPSSIHLRWFDLLAQQGYGGDIDLDSNLIAGLLQSGLRSPDEQEAVKVDTVLIGIAPGGEVAVWISGARVTHLVSMHRLPPIDIPLNDMSNDPADTFDTFANKYLEKLKPTGTSKSVRSLPDGYWATLANRVSYTPLVTGEFVADTIWLNFLNGETDWFDLTGNRVQGSSVNLLGLALPRNAEFNWVGPTGQNYLGQVIFDQSEVKQAFASLADGTKERPLVLEFEPVEATGSVDVFLRAGDLFYRFERAETTVDQI